MLFSALACAAGPPGLLRVEDLRHYVDALNQSDPEDVNGGIPNTEAWGCTPMPVRWPPSPACRGTPARAISRKASTPRTAPPRRNALDRVPYHGRELSIVWDRTGEHFHRGRGLRILAGGREIAHAAALGRITGRLQAADFTPSRPRRRCSAI